MSAVLLVVGAVLVVAGAGFVHWPFALVAAGVLAIAAGIDLQRDSR